MATERQSDRQTDRHRRRDRDEDRARPREIDKATGRQTETEATCLYFIQLGRVRVMGQRPSRERERVRERGRERGGGRERGRDRERGRRRERGRESWVMSQESSLSLSRSPPLHRALSQLLSRCAQFWTVMGWSLLTERGRASEREREREREREKREQERERREKERERERERERVIGQSPRLPYSWRTSRVRSQRLPFKRFQ